MGLVGVGDGDPGVQAEQGLAPSCARLTFCLFFSSSRPQGPRRDRELWPLGAPGARLLSRGRRDAGRAAPSSGAATAMPPLGGRGEATSIPSARAEGPRMG